MFVKSSYSGSGGECVEVARDELSGGVLVRDSKDQSGPVLSFTLTEWEAFLRGADDDEFDPDVLPTDGYLSVQEEDVTV